MLWLPIQKWERGEFGIHGYLVAAPTWWDHFCHIGSGPYLTYHRRRWLEKQGGTPRGPGEAGMLRKLGGGVGGSRSSHLKVTSHHFIMFPVSGKKKKKSPERGGKSPIFIPERVPPPQKVGKKMLWLPIQKWECGEFGIHGYLEAAITWWTLFPGHLIFKISCSLWGLCLGIRPASKEGGGRYSKTKQKTKKRNDDVNTLK